MKRRALLGNPVSIVNWVEKNDIMGELLNQVTP